MASKNVLPTHSVTSPSTMIHMQVMSIWGMQEEQGLRCTETLAGSSSDDQAHKIVSSGFNSFQCLANTEVH